MDHDRTVMYFLLNNERSDLSLHLRILRVWEFTFSIGRYADYFPITSVYCSYC